MKKIIASIRQHLASDFNPLAYTCTAILLVISVYYNYLTDFEDSFLDLQKGALKVFYFFIFYSFPFYSVLIITGLIKKELTFLKSAKFWIVSGLGFFLLSFDSSALFLNFAANKVFPAELFYWGFKVLNNFMSLLTITLPMFLIGWLLGPQKTKLFGMNNEPFQTSPYFHMLAIMLPVIFVAAFLPGFLNQYPMYNSGNSIQNYPQPELLYAGIYEVGYALNFISVEVFFRGFLVVGLMQYTGRKVVLAMAASYCFLHFGKPAGEAISSIFGGYILGVIAYETRTIWGGVMVHVGIAWAMELVAAVHHFLRPNV